MTLKDFYPFTRTVTEWCCEQSDLDRFSLEVDHVTASLVIQLEFFQGQRIYKINYMFSDSVVNLIRNQESLINTIEWKTKQVRDEIHGD